MRRAVALLSVLLVIVLGALMAMIALDQADATATAARVSLLKREARAIAWSGVLGAMSECEAQRADLMRGAAPELTAEWDVYTDGSITARVRVESVGDPADPELELLVQSESAKLNLNTATTPMLARLAGLGDERAQAVRERAIRGGFTSVEDLRAIGIDPQDEAGVLGGVALDQLATAYSLDPDLSAGVSDTGASGRERARWDPAAKEFDRRLNADTGTTEALTRLTEAGVDLSSASEVAGAFERLGIEPGVWAGVWDELAFGADRGGREGLIDISRASEAVLACIPGFEGKAREVHEAAMRLSDERARSCTWPLDAGVVTPAEMARALPWITIRSFHWRVRIIGELVRASDSGDEPQVLTRSTLESIIDCSGERARVAYLRDVTFDGAAEGLDSILALTQDMTRQQIDAEAGDEAQPDLANGPQGGDDAPAVESAGARSGAASSGSVPALNTGAGSGARRGRWAATR